MKTTYINDKQEKVIVENNEIIYSDLTFKFPVGKKVSVKVEWELEYFGFKKEK